VKSVRVLKLTVLLSLMLALAWWLFADTVRYHTAGGVAGGGGALRFSFYGAYEEYEMWARIVAGFHEQHPEVPVKLEYLPTRYEPKIRQLMVAGDAPDVMLCQDKPYLDLVHAGDFEDLTPYLEALGPGRSSREQLIGRYFTTAIDSYAVWEGSGGSGGSGGAEGSGAARSCHFYGLPVFGGSNLLIYNKGCFARAGVVVGPLPGPAGAPGLYKSPDDKTWIVDDQRWTLDEWLEVCRRLTLPAGPEGHEQYGFQSGWWLYWLPFQSTLGARVLTGDKTHTCFYGPAAEKSLQLFQDLQYQDHVSPRGLEMVMGQGMGFFTGRVAMIADGPWRTPFFNATDLDYDVLHFPRAAPGGVRITRVTWDAVTMYSQSKKKREAWLLIDYLLSAPSQRMIARAQRDITALRATAGDFVRQNPKVHMAKFVEAADTYAQLAPINEHWDMLARVCSRALGSVVDADPALRLTPAQAIGQMYDGQDPDSVELMTLMPPADPQEAARYRAIYRASGKAQ
jgi:ABC-type glycerol-3-phosphate transport system substrate-binding protein